MRLALEKATARFNLVFLGAMGIGGKAPNDAFAIEDSRACLLKNAPTYNTEDQLDDRNLRTWQLRDLIHVAGLTLLNALIK